MEPTDWTDVPEDEQSRRAMDRLREPFGVAPQLDSLNEGLPFVEVAALAEFLVDRLLTEQTSAFTKLFSGVESLITATPTTRYFAVVGFVEDLQNATLRAKIPLDRWRVWLEPNTTHAWSAVERMWARKLSARAFNEYVRTGDPRTLRRRLHRLFRH